MKAKYCSLVLILIPVLFMLGCGEGGYGAGGEEAPPSSTITINPTKLTLTGSTGQWYPTEFAIYVADSKGNPINKAKVTISYFAAVPVHDDCINMFDGSALVFTPFDAFTNEHGVYTLTFKFYLPKSGETRSLASCAHSGDMAVTSGAAAKTVAIDVN